MMWPARIARAQLPESGRIIAISDIHGNLPYLRGLLDKLALTEEDTLVFCGDMVEKGPQSLATLRYIMISPAPARAGARACWRRCARRSASRSRRSRTSSPCARR